MLHGYGGNHANALPGLSPAQALALRVGGAPLPPMALVTADGGAGYWNPHPGDNPQAMLTDELIPMCQRLGLGSAPASERPDRRHGDLDGRLRRSAARGEAPGPGQRGGRDQPGHLDQLCPGAGGQRRRVRVGRRLRAPTTR